MKAPEFIQKNISLKDLNSWRVGGKAQFYCAPTTADELSEAVDWALGQKLDIQVLGDGSNCLISDKGISGLVVVMKNFSGVESCELGGEPERLTIIAKCGTPKMDLMRLFLKNKLSPALFLSGLPGNLGGGIAMNAGVREDREPREFCEIVDWVEVLRFEPQAKILRMNHSDIKWTYRHSEGWQPGVLLRAQVSWPNDPQLDIPKRVMEANKLRLSKQPLDKWTCGSTFKNPEGKSAGQLIEEAGLKGFSIGGAQVSTKHANFIENTGEAKAEDIYNLIKHIQAEVKKSSGVDLTNEVKMLGDWG